MNTTSLLQDVDGNQKHVTLTGLSAKEVLERRSQFGENRLPTEKGVSAWTILFNQLKSPLVYIILAAAGISLALGEFGDFAIIMAVVVIDVILGFIQEYQAQRTYVALKGLLKPTTTVIRDGQRVEVEVWELVPGDLVVLNAGEKAPGDGELFEATKLSLDEAILTGESEPVNKQAISQVVEISPENDSAPQTQVFMGTTVVTGRGILRITKTGIQNRAGPDRSQPERACRGRDTPPGAVEGVQQDFDLYRRGCHTGDPDCGVGHGARILRYAAHLHHPGHCSCARGAAHRSDGDPGAGHAQDPQAQRPGEEAAGSGNARLGDGDLHRQNRHAHRGTYAGEPCRPAGRGARLANHGAVQQPGRSGGYCLMGICREDETWQPSGIV